MKKILPEAAAVTLISFALCQFKWTGSFSYEFSFFFGLAMFVIVFLSLSLRFRNHSPVRADHRRWMGYFMGLLLIPLTLVLLYSLKYGMCDWLTGLKWFLLLPVVTTLFTVCSVFFGLGFSTSTFKKIIIALTPTILFSLMTLIDLYFAPSLSFFHPVIGYFPGPFYDEWIPMFSSLYLYRLWIVALSIALLNAHRFGKNKWLILLFFIFPLFFRSELNWHTTHRTIQRTLGTSVESKYTNVYFDMQSVPNAEVLSKSLDFYVEYISKKLNLPVPTEKIRVYIYRNAYQKKRLTGTGNTLVGNPIQRALHLLPTDASDTILVHELTHVLAAPMGMPILKLSPHVSLLEGLATAMQPSHFEISIHEWTKAMIDLEKLPDIKDSLNAVSFWKENPVRVYFASGSFSKWLIDTHGIDLFKKVYAGQSFDRTYQKSIEELIVDWKSFLSSHSVSQETLDMADYFFSAKPFHQKQCVHEVAEAEMRFATCNKKIEDCGDFINRACELDPENPNLRLKRARYIYRKTLKPLDTALIPLPSTLNTRTQNNLIQLFNDDLHDQQTPQNAYDLSRYDHPSPGLMNAILARIYLARHSQEVLNGIILGDYVPDPNLTWNTKDPNYTQAMLYFAKLATREKQARHAIEFLTKIDATKENNEFRLSYWQLYAEAQETIGTYPEAIEAYQQARKYSQSDGEKTFFEFQVERLSYIRNN